VNRVGSGRRERKEALERFAGFRVTPAQGERRDQVSMRYVIIRTNRKRLPGQLYCLIVLLQPDIDPRFEIKPPKQVGIVRTEPNCLVFILKGLFKLSEVRIVPGHRFALA
jgi:hypothetical protein